MFIKTKLTWIAGAFVVAIACLWGSRADAQLRIQIDRGVERPYPIAIVPFGYAAPGGAPFDVAELVARDLDNSGRFESLPRSLLVSKPTRGSQVDFQDWRMQKVDYLVIGRLEPEGADRHTIIFQVFDTLRGEQLMGFRLPADNRALRRASHRVADMIYEKITGIPGAF